MQSFIRLSVRFHDFTMLLLKQLAFSRSANLTTTLDDLHKFYFTNSCQQTRRNPYTIIHAVSVKGPFIATQLNSTRRRVELSCVGEVSIATPTQLNSTQVLRPDNATELNSTRRRVELRRYKRALTR